MFNFIASISRTLLRLSAYCHVGQRRHSVGQNKLGVVGTQHYATLRRPRCETPLRLFSHESKVCNLNDHSNDSILDHVYANLHRDA